MAPVALESTITDAPALRLLSIIFLLTVQPLRMVAKLSSIISVAFLATSCESAPPPGQRESSAVTDVPEEVAFAEDSNCPLPAGAELPVDVQPEMINREEVMRSLEDRYAATGKEAEAVVNVYAHLGVDGVPICTGTRTVAGDTALRWLAMDAALRLHWTPAMRGEHAVPMIVVLGFSLCRDPEVDHYQYMHYCAPPSEQRR